MIKGNDENSHWNDPKQNSCKDLLNIYNEKYKNFIRVLSLLLGFLSLYFFIVFLPHFLIQVDSYSTSSQINDIFQIFNQQQNSLGYYSKLVNEYSLFRNNISQSKEMLDVFVKNLNSLNSFKECKNVIYSKQWYQCNVSKKINLIMNGNKDVFDNTITPLLILISGSKELYLDLSDGSFSFSKNHNQSSPPNNNILFLINTYNIWKNSGNMDYLLKNYILATQMTLNKYNNLKIPNSIQDLRTNIDTVNNNYFRTYFITNDTIGPYSNSLKSDINRINNTKTNLQNYLNILYNQEHEVLSRLNNLETPFGKISIGFKETITLFPIFIVIGFMICIFLLQDMMNLRLSLNNCFKIVNDKESSISKEIVFFAPLWIDPYNQFQNKHLQISILVIPFIIFVLSCGMIFYTWIISDIFSAVEMLNQWIFATIYVLSCILFLYGYSLVFIKYFNLKKVYYKKT
jgi:hypothetical protein